MHKSETAPIIIGKLLNIGGILRRKADRMLEPYHLNQQQFSILFTVGREKRVNQKQMINRMVLEKAHVSKIVKKLHALGLIAIEPCLEDRRSSWLSLTPRGEEVLHECRGLIADWNKEWTSQMPPEEMERLLEGLSMLQGILKEKQERP